MKCVFVYFGCRPVLLCVDSICCHYCSGSTWHLKWPAPNGSLSRPVFSLSLSFVPQREHRLWTFRPNKHAQEQCSAVNTYCIHACKTKLGSVCWKTLRVRYMVRVSWFEQREKKPNKATGAQKHLPYKCNNPEIKYMYISFPVFATWLVSTGGKELLCPLIRSVWKSFLA